LIPGVGNGLAADTPVDERRKCAVALFEVNVNAQRGKRLVAPEKC
jgi:hypothetical protein